MWRVQSPLSSLVSKYRYSSKCSTLAKIILTCIVLIKCFQCKRNHKITKIIYMKSPNYSCSLHLHVSEKFRANTFNALKFRRILLLDHCMKYVSEWRATTDKALLCCLTLKVRVSSAIVSATNGEGSGYLGGQIILSVVFKLESCITQWSNTSLLYKTTQCTDCCNGITGSRKETRFLKWLDNHISHWQSFYLN